MATGTLVEEVAEEVAQNLEEVAEVTRRIDTRGVGIFLGGIGVGVAIGFYFGYKWNKEKIRAEAFRESEEEVARIREDYHRKTIAAQNKPSADEVAKIIEDRGYSTDVDASARLLPAPVPIIDDEALRQRLSPATPVEPDWVYDVELAQRNPEFPHIIHQDEFRENEREYQQVTYTYYNTDDVLVGEDEKPLPHTDAIVGQDNLRFGHGSEDPNVVYVRNDKLMLEMEITRSPGSYEEEVMGLDRDEPA